MAAYTISSRNVSVVLLADEDTVTVTRPGSISLVRNGGGAIENLDAQSSNAVTIDGVVSNGGSGGNGVLLIGRDNTVTVGANGYVWGLSSALVLGGASTITNSGMLTGFAASAISTAAEATR